MHFLQAMTDMMSGQVGGSVEAFGALIKREVEKYALIANTLKAKVD